MKEEKGGVPVIVLVLDLWEDPELMDACLWLLA